MSAISSPRRSVVVQRSGLSRWCLAAAVLMPAVWTAGVTQAQDGTREMCEAAKTWTMSRIAEFQAAFGEFQAAKRTVTQIGAGEPGPSDVTTVWFCNGVPIYDHPPGCSGWGRGVWQEIVPLPGQDGSADRVPSTRPPGLPSNYLAPDPRHGAVANFTDEYDSHGTRVTSRRYADGYVVIETPRADSQAK